MRRKVLLDGDLFVLYARLPFEVTVPLQLLKHSSGSQPRIMSLVNEYRLIVLDASPSAARIASGATSHPHGATIPPP